MVPWEFRNIELMSKQTSENPYSSPSEIRSKVVALVNSFNTAIESVNWSNDEEALIQKKDIITRFVLDLVRIHPFGDGNGRIGWVLSDILFFKHNLPTIGLLRCYKLHKDAFTKSSFSEILGKILRNFMNLLRKIREYKWKLFIVYSLGNTLLLCTSNRNWFSGFPSKHIWLSFIFSLITYYQYVIKRIKNKIYSKLVTIKSEKQFPMTYSNSYTKE